MDQHDAISPEQWVRQAQNGDSAAFSQLVRRYQRTALAVAYAVVGDACTARDVTQEATLRAWQRVGDLKTPEKFAPWLCSLVRNLAIDARRRTTRLTSCVDEEIADPSADPVYKALQRERAEQIDAALGMLEETTRVAVALRYYEGLTAAQIGVLLDLSPAAVDTRLSRARAELRKLLADASPSA